MSLGLDLLDQSVTWARVLSFKESIGPDFLAVEKLFRKDLPLELSAGVRFQIASTPVMFTWELPDLVLTYYYFLFLIIRLLIWLKTGKKV